MNITTKIRTVFPALLIFMAAAPVSIAHEGDDAPAEAGSDTLVLTLQDALNIALNENVSVKVADQEVKRSEYARKGTYASLFPQVDGSGSYQRTIKKQIMYMDTDSGNGDEEGGGSMGMFGSLMPYLQRIGELSAAAGMPPVQMQQEDNSASANSGFAVGRWNTYNYGVSAALPLINFQLWENIRISGQSVDLAVEKARSSRLDMVTQVKQAFYAVLLAKEAFDVYRSVYENAVDNFSMTEKKYNAQKASELDYLRSKANVANAVPNVYNAESQVILALWQLKAVMGLDLDRNIDVAGCLNDYSEGMLSAIADYQDPSLDLNSTMRQLEIQAEQLASTIRLQKAACLPSLSAAFSYSMIAMTNDFKFSEYKWSPYSYVGLSLSVPIFSGGKRLNNIRQAKVQAAELDLQRVDTERQLKIAIRQYLSTMETSMNSYASAAEAVTLAQKAYDIATKSYNVGKNTITDLNDAQLSLTQAKLSESQAIYNFIIAKSNLEKTIGFDVSEDAGN